MHIVVAPLDKKVENLKIFIWFFTKIYIHVPLTRGFPTMPTLLVWLRFQKVTKVGKTCIMKI